MNHLLEVNIFYTITNIAIKSVKYLEDQFSWVVYIQTRL